jgi:chromate transporter
MRDNDYLSLALIMSSLSIIAVGGAPGILAPMQRETVDVHHWITARDFVEMFAITKFAPGPGAMTATLIGYKVAGWTGALVATLALFIPSSALCLAVSRVWTAHRGRPWRRAVEEGLAPIAAGLMLSGGFVIFRLSNAGFLSWGAAVAVALVISRWAKVHPFVLLVIGAVIFVAARPFGLR